MKKASITFLFALASLLTNAQAPDFSQNMFTRLAYNPAYAGMSGGYNTELGYKYEWYAAREFSFNGDATLPFINSGIGVTWFNNTMGYQYINEVKLSYSYHISLCQGILAGGASFGYNIVSVNHWWDPYTGSSSPISISTYDVGLGLYYTTKNGAYIGIATAKLAEKTYVTSTQDISYNVPRQYYFNAGYIGHISSDCDFLPDAYVQASTSYDYYQLNMRLQCYKSFWAGFGYRVSVYNGSYSSQTDYALLGMAGIMHEFKDGSTMKIGYSYDFLGFPSAYFYGGGSNELHLLLLIKQKPKETVSESTK